MRRTLASAVLGAVALGTIAIGTAPAQAAETSSLPWETPASTVDPSAAPQIDTILTPLNGSGTPEFLGENVAAGARVEVTYAGHTSVVTATEAGFFAAAVPGGRFVAGQDRVTAVQLHDGQRSATGTYTIDDRFLPRF
ncbi:hypothetical protein [Curtobacterium luteum]|uniref:Bacterial Ig domain-containing protein n=1 Tax=Curtobacterium luteum TaxID=33881 RepID=A0A175RMH9_9MICO|nr:hypothetical protein [Curtobacterium luteum]KTR04558.1 hypothetical protein NS184_11800 [Curtobacterium luteum]